MELDLKNKKFGRLTLLEPIGKDELNFILWKCKCDCGKEHVTRGSYVSRGMIRSCGCLRKENHILSITKPAGISALNCALKNYRSAALKRGLPFELTKQEFDEIMKQNCMYCGDSPRSMYNGYLGTGIDRKNSDLGYIKINCAPCCTTCNKMKSKLGAKIFLDKILKISEHFMDMAKTRLSYSSIYDA